MIEYTYMKKLVFFIFFVVIVTNIFASTLGDDEYTCPLCGMKFKSRTSYSGYIEGRNLDLRPYGAIMIPSPIHKCPNCNFVFNNNFFTGNEIMTIEEALKKNNIFEKESDMPKYYYLAREAEIVNRNLTDIIWLFLSAVWENSPEWGNEDETKKNKLINITIEYINKLNKTDESYNEYQLIKLDLLRRSGQFIEAMEQIKKIKKNKEFYKDNIIKIIDLQIELIKMKNQEEHPLPSKEIIEQSNVKKHWILRFFNFIKNIIIKIIENAKTAFNKAVTASPPNGGSGYTKTQSGLRPLCVFVPPHLGQGSLLRNAL